MPILVTLTVSALKLWTYCYELLTWPIYYFFQSDFTLTPISNVELSNGKILAKQLNINDPDSSWRNVKALDGLCKSIMPGCNTLNEQFSHACKIYGERRCLGTRKLVKSEMEIQPNGKQFKKLTFEKYYWETYRQVDERVENFGKGLIKLGLQAGVDNVLVFAETRSEWMIAAQAGFRFNLPIVTLYATLGEEAIVHGINESGTKVVVTSEELMPKLCNVINQCQHVKHVIFMNNFIFKSSVEDANEAQKWLEKYQSIVPKSVILHEMSEIELEGKSLKVKANGDAEGYFLSDYTPTASSLAIIMYTSGSTGKPKGVMMNHRNLMSAMAGQFEGLPPMDNDSDIYIGYLPLAHVLELCCENVVVSQGIPVGYSSPLTLTDNASKIKSGSRGDIAMLKPTLMACVPTILDRITKSVWEKATDNGPLFLEMFRWAYNYKSQRMDNGYPSLFMDKFVFKKIKRLLGGKVRYMLSGGAPLSDEAQNFINICFCPIIQGYGLTETCGAGTLMVDGDRRVGQVGPPLNSVEIRLSEWIEGGYAPTDKPKPRGEVLIGGDCVTQGYFQQPDKTEEDFFVDKNNVRWFCTGDIGVFHTDGSLSVVDRKKDLVKLQGGEYVSLARVELAVSSCPIVDAVCAYADSSEEYLVVLLSAKNKQLIQLAEKIGVQDADESNYEDLCNNEQVKAELLKAIQKACREKKLERMEIPIKVHIDNVSWTPETGLVTDALKLKRRNIQDKFQEIIKQMYNKKSELKMNNNNNISNNNSSKI